MILAYDYKVKLEVPFSAANLLIFDFLFALLCKQLFAELWDGHTPLRLLGVALTDLTREDTAQMSLFPDEKKERSRKLDKAYDAIKKSSALLRFKEDLPYSPICG